MTQSYIPRFDQDEDPQYSFGQIAYRGYREVMRNAPEWFQVSRIERAAWEVAAVNIMESLRSKREVRVIHPRRRKRDSQGQVDSSRSGVHDNRIRNGNE